MTCRACVQLPLDVDGIDTSINTQILKTPRGLIVRLADLYNGRNPEIGTLKKDKGDIFSGCCIESFKSKFLQYVNEVLFEMVKKALKDTHLWGTTPIALQNEVTTYRKIYYDKDNSVNDLYTRFLFKIYSLQQEVRFLLDISAIFFNKLSPDIR